MGDTTHIERWSKFQLANPWKLRGIILCIAAFVALLALKSWDGDKQLLKDILGRVLLIGLLIISLSKEKDEDEMIASLRAKSYALAFIFAVMYTMYQPLLVYVLDKYVFEPNPNNTFSYFEVLSFMFIIQIMCFEVLKRNR